MFKTANPVRHLPVVRAYASRSDSQATFPDALPDQSSSFQRSESGLYVHWSAFALLMLVSVLLGLTGCGPGTGGTGTGPISSSVVTPPVGSMAATSIGYSGVLTATQSTVTGSPAVAAPALPAASPGQMPPAATNGVTVTLALNVDRVVLSSGCLVFTSQSPLSGVSASETALPGTVETLSTRGDQRAFTTAPASLLLLFDKGQADSNSVRLTLKDSAGNPLLGPVTLTRSSLNPTSDTAPPTASGTAKVTATVASGGCS